MTKRALISVSDKNGVVDLARELHELGFEILSTGGTKKALEEAGLPVTGISEVTGFPEILGGRVKTLHPKVHGGLLARLDLAEHQRDLEDNGILPIQIVCVNLYPFQETIAKELLDAKKGAVGTNQQPHCEMVFYERKEREGVTG